MLYLRTGGNGSGKTLFTLKDVRELQLKTNRPVCFNLRPADYPDVAKANTPYSNLKQSTIEGFGWKGIHFKDWEAQADGTIFLVDECHYDMPTRGSRDQPPPWIQRLTEHRSRGFDFFLLTQHPKNIDSFVRNLVQAPGWHEHVKRQGGSLPVARVMRWDAVNLQCEQFGSGKNAQGQTRGYPREVYEWYDSAYLHTGRVRIPKQVLLLVAALVGVPLLFWAGLGKVTGGSSAAKKDTAPGSLASAGGGGLTAGTTPAAKKSAAEYVEAFRPRVNGLQHTAPVYDELTKPARVPVPVACVSMGERCSCYTQDATAYTTTLDICRQIVQKGLWLDFRPEGQSGSPTMVQAPGRPAGGVGGPVAVQTAAAPSIQAPGYALIGSESPRASTTVAGAVAQTQVPARVPPSSPWSFQAGR